MIDTTRMTLNGHVISVFGSRDDLLDWCSGWDFLQFSLTFLGTEWMLSAPLDKDVRKEFKWLYHKMEGLKAKESGKDKPDPNKPKGGGPSGSGPGKPTPPNSGGGSVFVPEDVMAVAA